MSGGATRSVLVAMHRLSTSAQAALKVACAAAELPVVPWYGLGRPADGVALVVAGLRAGERRVPEEIARFMDASWPDTPLLLVTDEPLRQPVLSLVRGRVTLMGQSALGEQGRAVIDALLRDERVDVAAEADAGEATARGTPGGIHSREQLRARFWLARLAAQEDPAAGGPRLPPVLESPRWGLLAAVTPAEEAAPVALDEELFELLRRADRAAAATLAARLPGAGAVMFSPVAEEWTVFWPLSWPLWLLSSARLPRQWDLGLQARAADPAIARLPAHRDDVVMALSNVCPDEQQVLEALPGGGPALLAALEQVVSRTPVRLGGVLVMVR